MDTRNIILKYLMDEYYEGDIEKIVNATGYSRGQINDWLNGMRCPQKQTIEYIIHMAFVPEFTVITEFKEFKSDEPVLTQLKIMLAGHTESPGIYAFYDSMANLLYIGKATKLLDECYSAIKRDVDVQFPSGVKNVPSFRYEIVKYISAYHVGKSDWVDLPKHVESLLLRISKPPLNKQIGYLERAYTQPPES